MAAHLHDRLSGAPLAARLSRLGSLLAHPCADRGLAAWSLASSVILSACHLVTRLTRLSLSPSLLLAIVALAMLPFSVVAARSGYPIGGDHGANDGIEQVAAYLKSLPSGTVVYDHWLAWQLGYYLGDGFAYLAYFDTPAALADDLRVFAGHDDRYVIFPARESPDKVIDAIGQVGYTLTPVLETQNRFGADIIHCLSNRKTSKRSAYCVAALSLTVIMSSLHPSFPHSLNRKDLLALLRFSRWSLPSSGNSPSPISSSRAATSSTISIRIATSRRRRCARGVWRCGIRTCSWARRSWRTARPASSIRSTC